MPRILAISLMRTATSAELYKANTSFLYKMQNLKK
nr:MAG TPA: hypothetical protein [Caudoviricetes sp.]